MRTQLSFLYANQVVLYYICASYYELLDDPDLGKALAHVSGELHVMLDTYEVYRVISCSVPLILSRQVDHPLNAFAWILYSFFLPRQKAIFWERMAWMLFYYRRVRETPLECARRELAGRLPPEFDFSMRHLSWELMSPIGSGAHLVTLPKFCQVLAVPDVWKALAAILVRLRDMAALLLVCRPFYRHLAFLFREAQVLCKLRFRMLRSLQLRMGGHLPLTNVAIGSLEDQTLADLYMYVVDVDLNEQRLREASRRYINELPPLTLPLDPIDTPRMVTL